MLCYETRHRCDATLPTHRHREAYAALVIDGGYEESSVDGPLACRPGTLLLHPPFHAHGDRFGRQGAHVINLAWPAGSDSVRTQAYVVPDLREAIAVFRRAPGELDALRAACVTHEDGAAPAWQRAFVEALEISDRPLTDIARDLGVSAEHASRALTASFGMSPQRLRRELRWRRALALLRTPVPLADIAIQAGFSDQSHFTRVAREHAGLPPAALREHIKCVQDAGAAAGF